MKIIQIYTFTTMLQIAEIQQFISQLVVATNFTLSTTEKCHAKNDGLDTKNSLLFSKVFRPKSVMMMPSAFLG